MRDKRKVLHQEDLKNRDARTVAKEIKRSVGTEIATIDLSDGVGVINFERGLITPKLYGAGDFLCISDCHPFIDGNYVVNHAKDKIIEIEIPFHKGLSHEYHGSKFKHKYHGGILSSQVVSRKNVFPVIILGLNDGKLSNACDKLVSIS